MPETQNTGVTPVFKELPLSSCFESVTNPRHRYDKQKFADLVTSVRAKGVIEPVIARPAALGSGRGFEVIAGSRRYRASVEAGRPTLPAMVAEYSDTEAREIQLIENLNREDVHPMEEAEGFAELLKQPGYTAQVISEKIGHPLDYVVKRLQLIQLFDKAREAFLADKIQIGHAWRLARLEESAQRLAFKELLFDRSRDQYVGGKWVQCEPIAVSIRDFDLRIREKIMLDLHAAPWKKDDAELVPAAGACTACPKRTSSNQLLFDDLKKNEMCLDRVCFEGKRKAFLAQIQTAAKQAGTPLVRITAEYMGGRSKSEKDKTLIGQGDYREIKTKADECGSAEAAVMVDGPRCGHQFTICKDPKCPKHRGNQRSSGGSTGKTDYWAVRAQKLKGRISFAVRVATIKAIAGKLAAADWTIPPVAGQVIASALLGNQPMPPDLPPALGLAKAKDGSAARSLLRAAIYDARCSLPVIITGLALAGAAKEYCWEGSDDTKRLAAAAKAHKVDAAAIRRKLTADMSKEFKAKRAAAQARKAKEAAKAKKPAAKRKAAAK